MSMNVFRPSGRNPLVIALVVTAALVVALAALSTFAGGFAGTTSSSNEYEGVTTIELDMRASGSVEIAASEGDRVTVERSVRSLLGSPHADEDQRGDSLGVRSRCALWNIGFLTGCNVDYVLRVPVTTEIRGRATNGSIEITGIDGEIDVSTSNGSVTIDGGEGPLLLRTSNGRVEVTNTQSSQIDTRTSNGPISVNADSVPDTIRAQTSNGRIDIVVPADAPPYAVDVQTSNGSTDVEIPTDPASPISIDTRTSNGDISIRSAPEAGFHR